MPQKHYSPAIDRFLVSVLYHEAKGKGLPMTTLTNQLLEEALIGSASWQKAEEVMQLREPQPPDQTS